VVPAEPVSPLARRVITAAGFGLVTLGIYIRTLAPTVAGGDSGELITAGYTLGVLHPPGYPLYTLLAKIFTFIPIGTIAWRVNLLSAVCGAAAATLLFLAVARWSRSVWGALVSASLFAFSRRVWPHAVTAEVFALNNLFVAGIVYLTVRFSGELLAEATAVRRRHVVACVLFFWIGLGLTNHHTLIFYALPAAIFVLLDPPMREPRRIGTYVLCGVLGLVPYLYLPLASARIPLMSWGDQTTAHGFVNHLLRREYGTFRLGIQEQGPNLPARLAAYISGSLADLLWIGPILAIVGLAVWIRRPSRALAWCWAGAFLLFVIAFNSLANGPLEPGVSRFVEGRFWQQPHLLVCVFAGLGLAAMADRGGSSARVALPIVAVAIAIAQPLINFRDQDKSKSVEIREFLKATLDSAPKGALLLEQGDYMFHGLRYLQIVERYRTDVRVLDQMVLGYPWHQRLARKYFSDVTFPGIQMLPTPQHAGEYDMKSLFDANRDRMRIFLCDVNLWEGARATYTPWPSGLLDEVLLKPRAPALTEWIARGRDSFAGVNLDALRRTPEESWEHVALKYFWKQMGKHALSLGRWGGEHGNEPALRRAAEVMEIMLAQWPEAPHTLHRDLGITYQQLAQTDPSLLVPMRREFEAYLRDAPLSDPSVPAIRQILERGK
jgi:dolichyl-phosphate-mannose-protein mannosyltransferase